MNAIDAFNAAERFTPEEPAPLMREIPPGEPYPLEALGALRAVAEAVHNITQAPAAIGAQSVLGVAALAAQALGDVETLAGRAPASLFLLTIAQSGERKSSCDKHAIAPVRDFEREICDAYRAEAVDHQNRLDIWTARRAAIMKRADKDPASAQADLANLGATPEPPLSPIVIATEPTFEGLAKTLAGSRPSLGLFNDEGGAFIGGHGMNSDNRLKTIAGLSLLWDGAPINRTRAGDGVSTHRGRRLSAHLMAQPVAAAGLLSDPMAQGQGFLARFLMTEPPSAIGTRTREGHDAASERAVETFAARIGDMLRRPLLLREGTRNELDPPLLALEPKARALLQAFALEVERAQLDGRDLATVRPFASKAAEHAARLAAVLTLYDDPDAARVTAATMADAVTLAGFYLREAVRLAGGATISKETAEAELLRRWLATWPEPFISPSDVAQLGPPQIREAAAARRILKFLEGFGHVAKVEGAAEVRGKRRREVFRIVRGAW